MQSDAGGGSVMAYRVRALVVVLTIALAAGCAGAIPDPLAGAAEAPAVPLPPIAGHPPVTVTGVVALFDPATDTFRLDDGRMVQLTGRSRVVLPIASAIRIGDAIVLHDVLPVGVQSGVKTLALGQPQRMGTIASVDEARGLVTLTDGTAVRVNRSTNVHLGATGSNIALARLSPGDELVAVLGGGDAGAVAPVTDDATAPPSALPREDQRVSPAVDADEVMVFKVPRR
jgi:hypothetical protein